MVAVSVMDGIMFEAQRQGRLSFYMVLSPPAQSNILMALLTSIDRSLPVKKELQLGQPQP